MDEETLHMADLVRQATTDDRQTRVFVDETDDERELRLREDDSKRKIAIAMMLDRLDGIASIW
jgi:hypothetical protein